MTLAIVFIIFIKHEIMVCRVNYESENVLKEAINNSEYYSYAYVKETEKNTKILS
jgi:hypothetical protein